MTVRTALIGAGVMGADHARIIAESAPGAAVQVICDTSAERARAVADISGAADISDDPEAVIRRNDVDAVLIASPDETHAPLSAVCIEVGKPFLCEKPLSQDARECLQIVEAELKCGKKLAQVGFMRRFDPSYTEMKAALENGAIGEPVMMHNFHRNLEAPSHFTGPMAVTNSAPHEFDIARFVLNIDYTAISVFQPGNTAEYKVCPPVMMVLETAAGPLVNIEINVNAGYGYDVRGELIGSSGSVVLNAPVYTRVNSSLRSSEVYPKDWRPRFEAAYRAQNQAWIKSVASGVFPESAADAWDGYCAAVTAGAGVQALTENRRVPISYEEKPVLYNG